MLANQPVPTGNIYFPLVNKAKFNEATAINNKAATPLCATAIANGNCHKTLKTPKANCSNNIISKLKPMTTNTVLRVVNAAMARPNKQKKVIKAQKRCK